MNQGSCLRRDGVGLLAPRCARSSLAALLVLPGLPGYAQPNPARPGQPTVVAWCATAIPAARDVRGNGLKTHH